MDKKEQEIFEEALDRFRRAVDADSECREDALDDIRFCFVEGEQWDEAAKKSRGTYRPMYEFNRIRQAVRQVLGDQRKQRPSGKVRGVDGGTDPEFAETVTGLIRNIESVSNAERAYDMAYEFAVAGGKGAWRICTKYASDTAFEQEVRIEEIANPFAVHFDPAAQEFDRRDALYAFVTERIGKEEHKRLYPDADESNWEGVSDNHALWVDDETVQVAEYWRKVPIKRTLCLMSNGETIDKAEVEPVLDELAAAGVTVVKERVVDTYKVEQYIVSGAGVLEGPTEFPSKYIPIVPCWGDLICIEGKWRYSGMVRFAKDAQRIHNYQLTTAIETVALTPKAPFILTPAQIKGHEPLWNSANSENLPYLLANPDPSAGGMPQRAVPAAMPAAMLTLAQVSGDELKATTGIYDASLGARSNETSGKAILARQNEGDTANYAYIDNLGRAISYTWEILVDLLPRVYDTQRTIRVLGEDGAEKWATLNQTVIDQQTGKPVKVYDLSKAKFDVVVTVGPSFQTARMELADSLMGLSQANPQIGMMMSDLMVRNLDMPGSDEVAKRIRRFLEMQGLVEPEAEGEQPVPPKVQAMIAQGKQVLDAQAQAIQGLQQQLQIAGQELAALKLKDQAKEAEFAVRIQELELQRAELALKLKEQQDKQAVAVGELQIKGFDAETKRLAVEKDAALEVANVATKQSGEGMAQLGQGLVELQAQIQAVADLATKPKVKRTKATRVGDGQWVTETIEAPEGVN